MGQTQLQRTVVFSLEMLWRDMACCLWCKSAACVNMSEPQCDNPSVTLGRRVVFVSLRLTDQTQGHPVHISCPATASRHGRVKGLRWKSDIYQEKWGWWSSILAEYSAVLSGEWNICSLTILADSFVMYAVYFWHYCIMILGESVVLYNTDRPKWFLLNWRSRAVHLCTKKKKKDI